MRAYVDGEDKGEVKNCVKVIIENMEVTVTHEGIIVDEVTESGEVSRSGGITFDEFLEDRG